MFFFQVFIIIFKMKFRSIDGIEDVGVSVKAHIVDGEEEAKSKSRKSAPIPMAYFPLGSNFS